MFKNKKIVSDAPMWLEELQKQFGDLIQTPLSVKSGKFEADVQNYSSEILGKIKYNKNVSNYDRIKIYHNQYWYRLFNTMQKYYPRFSYAIGYWHFNNLAVQHIIESPPYNFNLNEAINGFYYKIINAIKAISSKNTKVENNFWVDSLLSYNISIIMIRQAINIDEAQLRSFKYKYFSNIDLKSKKDITNFFSHKIEYSKSFGLVKEDWNLSLLNKNNIKGEITKHKIPKYFVFYRTGTSSAIENIEPLFAKFLSYCTQYNINISIKNMERNCNNLELERFNQKLIDWITISVQKKWWISFK